MEQVKVMFILDNKDREPLHNKIYNRIKHQILSGELPAAAKLLSVKNLAIELSVSRNTVEHAYQQLHAEGYIYSKPRSGYYVSLIDSEYIAATRLDADMAGQQFSEDIPSYSFDFHPACLSPGSFPVNLWRKLYMEGLKEDAKQFTLYSHHLLRTALHKA